MLIVHAGNRIDARRRAVARFPADQVDSVRARVRLLLTALQPERVLSNAAAGADLIVLAEAQRLGIPVDVVLPIAEDEFVRQSVADNGDEWVAAFHQVLARAEAEPQSTVRHGDQSANDDWYESANEHLLEEALHAAARTSPPNHVVALTIRPLPTRGEESITDHFAELAERAGLLVLTLDPARPEHPVVVSTR